MTEPIDITDLQIELAPVIIYYGITVLQHGVATLQL